MDRVNSICPSAISWRGHKNMSFGIQYLSWVLGVDRKICFSGSMFGKPRDAEQWLQVTIFSVYNSYPWWNFFLINRTIYAVFTYIAQWPPFRERAVHSVYLACLRERFSLCVSLSLLVVIREWAVGFDSTVELQWLEHWWLVYHGCFELVLESLGKNPLAADLG